MEDLLPLLIGVIWLAYTWFNKEQKKKNAARSGKTGEQKTKPEKEPSILEQILMGQEIRVPEPEEVLYEAENEKEKVEPVPVVNKAKPWRSSAIERFTEEGTSVLRGKSPITLHDIEQEEDGYDPVFNPDDFDLQQAVVYAEILHPPYIDYK